ncbi:type II toxin-antitoxin system Phd/YefM family antitoxin [Candidatus Uhrbacteria bacterium]|nr:type II toxin-antitoxin system Phd/YefM family antitoxin [Candidatus Uhrbacteria bacterium]
MHTATDTIVFSARDAKNSFGRLLDEARDRPVFVEKHGRRVAVMMSLRAYEELETIRDANLYARAMAADKRGYLGVKQSAKVLKNILHARD